MARHFGIRSRWKTEHAAGDARHFFYCLVGVECVSVFAELRGDAQFGALPMLDDFAHFVHIEERVGSEHVLEFNDAVLCEWEIAQEVVCELLLGVAAISFDDVLTLPHVIIDVVRC